MTFRLTHVSRALFFVVYSVLGSALLLGVAEAFVRILDPDLPINLAERRDSSIRQSELLGTEFRPNCRGKVWKWPMRTNELGLRGAPLRADGSIRILSLGDSNTYGWGSASTSPTRNSWNAP